MNIVFKHRNNKPDAFNVRAAVFMVEQGFTYDFDQLDDNPEVIYITAYDADAPSDAIARDAQFDNVAESGEKATRSHGSNNSAPDDFACDPSATSGPGYPIGTARIFPAALEWQFPEDLEAGENGWVVGRIAVRKEARGTGLGSKILEEAERVAAEAGGTEMHLHAQVRAQKFYHANGYEEYGGYADDEGIPHQWMRKPL